MSTVILPTVGQVPYPMGWGYDGYIDELLLRFAVSPQQIMQRVTAEATPLLQVCPIRRRRP